MDFVNLVCRNVAGALPWAEERDCCAGFLQGSGGGMTRAEPLRLAAVGESTPAQLNPVGLRQAGVRH